MSRYLSRARDRRMGGLALLAAAMGALAIGVLRSQSSSAEPIVPRLHAAGGPVPLRGRPLRGGTGLRLVVADAKPFVLDVDTGVATRLRGIEAVNGGVVVVLGVSERAAVVVADPLLPSSSGQRYARNTRIYAVGGARTTASFLGAGSLEVAPDASGLGVWTTRIVSRSRCQLKRVGLDGRTNLPRPIPCNWNISPAGSLGLVVNQTRVIDPLTGRTVLRTRLGVLAVARWRVLLAGPGYADAPNFQFTLMDTSTHSQHRFRWPSTIRELDSPAVDPQGRYIAIGFGDPAWNQGPEQVLDVWVLDTKTAMLTHLPGMPAYVHLKFTSMQWTYDGRLVLLGQDDERTFVAVWRPGQQHLNLKNLRLPTDGNAGSDSFAVVH